MAGEHDKLEVKAEELLTEVGRLKALTRLYVLLSSGTMTRDQTAGCIGAKGCIKEIHAIAQERDRAKQHDELLSAHRETQALLKQAQGMGVTSFDREGVQLPRRAESKDPPH